MPESRPDASAAFALHRKALAALSRSAAVGSGDFDTSVRGLTELATQVLDCERASVWRLRPDRTAIESSALRDPRTREFAESYLGPLGITSMLDIPVFRG